MTKRLLLLLILPVWSTGSLGDPLDEDTPSLELLDYLAEYGEDENGGLLDPLEQLDENETRGYSYREYMQERTDR